MTTFIRLDYVQRWGRKKDIPIDRFVVSFGGNDFGCKVIWRTAQRPGDIGDFLGESKVCNLQMAMTIEEKILRLKIPIDDMMCVKILQGQGDFGSIEFRYGVRKALSK